MRICSFATQDGPQLGLVEDGIVYEAQGICSNATSSRSAESALSKT
jgi:hypothetical protein